MPKWRVPNLALVGGAVSVGLASLAGGVVFIMGYGSVDVGGRAMELGVGVTLIAAAAWTVVGLRMLGRSRSSGGVLVATGALPVAVCFWWTGVVPVVAGSVAVAGLIRSRRANQNRTVSP